MSSDALAALDPLARIARHRLVPVIAIDSVDHALPLADALLAGGLPIIEVTFRTAAARDVIRLLARERPELLVGAGTVLDPATVDAALEAGARFALAPGCSPSVVNRARAVGLPFVPGVQTPTEVERALELGCTTLKFFPAEAAGGVTMLEALHAPYAHTGVRFVPTGGVSPTNLASYLACKAVAAIGGTWLAKPADMAAGNFAAIAARTRAAVAATARRETDT
ncbi:MAG: bifunctional 4-hydroxy-2-oxoglutarate aldolase/2-dehydro-3-deoxy-phosphogluconate aldolase [Planctomycetia bacterium]|jgi:2-dehydro-3-deoxyphosphogluconate aldolase/(4S)-4-hydroxy-2-oxoglutarate aldolase